MTNQQSKMVGMVGPGPKITSPTQTSAKLHLNTSSEPAHMIAANQNQLQPQTQHMANTGNYAPPQMQLQQQQQQMMHGGGNNNDVIATLNEPYLMPAYMFNNGINNISNADNSSSNNLSSSSSSSFLGKNTEKI